MNGPMIAITKAPVMYRLLGFPGQPSEAGTGKSRRQSSEAGRNSPQ